MTCHVPGCGTPTSPQQLLCLKHWALVPVQVRDELSVHYRRGQRMVTFVVADGRARPGDPSREWIEAARKAIDTCAQREVSLTTQRCDRCREMAKAEQLRKIRMEVAHAAYSGLICPRCFEQVMAATQTLGLYPRRDS